jgi:hypothetical protein
MRNYFQVFAAATRVLIEPGGTPFYSSLYSFGVDEFQVANDQANQIAQMKTFYPDPPNKLTFDSPFGLQKVYICLDKDNLMSLLTGPIRVGDIIYQYFIGTFDGTDGHFIDQTGNTQFRVLVNPKTSPRYTGWTDAAGDKRQPAPSDKGQKGTPVNQALSLAQTIADVVSLLARYPNTQFLIRQGMDLLVALAKVGSKGTITKDLLDRINAFFAAVANFEKTIRL